MMQISGNKNTKVTSRVFYPITTEAGSQRWKARICSLESIQQCLSEPVASARRQDSLQQRTSEPAVDGFDVYNDCRTAGAEWEGAGVPHAPQVTAELSCSKCRECSLSDPVLQTYQGPDTGRISASFLVH